MFSMQLLQPCMDRNAPMFTHAQTKVYHPLVSLIVILLHIL